VADLCRTQTGTQPLPKTPSDAASGRAPPSGLNPAEPRPIWENQARREMDCPIPVASRKIMLVAPAARSANGFYARCSFERGRLYLRAPTTQVAFDSSGQQQKHQQQQ